MRSITPKGAILRSLGQARTFARLAAAFVLAGPFLAPAQEPGAATPAGPLRIFIESPGFDLGEIAKSIPFIETSARLEDAQVVVAVKKSAPEVFEIAFTGRLEFEGKNDTMTYPVAPGKTEAEVRTALLQTIKLGLLRYVSKTPLSSRVTISLLDQVKPTSVSDPWHFWVFSLGLNTFLNGEKSYKSQNWMGNFSANRVTPEWKIRLSLSGHSSKDVYSIEDYHYESTSRSTGFMGLVVKSLTDHWSAGGFFMVNSSTYQNIKLSLIPAAAVEYDVFPYSESTKRQLRILYQVGYTNIRYREETIYDKTRESLWSESLSATLELKRPWGTISTSLEGQHYFHDFSKNRLELNGEVSIRVFRGLKFNIDGGGSRIHDQLFLAKGGASFEEVLLRRRQLETTYNYYFSLGLSYTFGSIFSNIVNPRFGSGSGMSIRISM
jgi:hypothetical protein